jgi:hypothetical protein
MRIESSVTSVSWIPSELVSGLYKAGFIAGASHPDDLPPDVIANVTDLDELFAAGRFRFANRLTAWIEVQDGHIVDAGYTGRGYISCTRFGWGPHREVTFQPTSFPELRAEPEITATGARFSQTAGGRTGAPMPRPVSGRPSAPFSTGEHTNRAQHRVGDLISYQNDGKYVTAGSRKGERS